MLEQGGIDFAYDLRYIAYLRLRFKASLTFTALHSHRVHSTAAIYYVNLHTRFTYFYVNAPVNAKSNK